jgi:hypothetical protein
MGARLKILMSFRFKKGTQINYHFCQKVPVSESPPCPLAAVVFNIAETAQWLAL